MTSTEARFIAFGDQAVLVELAGDDDEVEARVRQLTAVAERTHRRDPRFGPPVPGFSSVLVPVDPLDPGVDEAIDVVRDLVAQALEAPAPPIQPGPIVEVPTRYGGRDGPDLDDVAALHGLSPGDVVALHASVEYRARFLGFAPGFAYLWRLPAELATPRLSTPRERVPAGSVAIAGEQTAVYPSSSPGGWRLIGRTDLRVWDASADPPALLLPGRRVRFVPVRDR